MLLCRFKNMDKLIHHTNLDGRINVLYSTPSQYVAAKHAYNRSGHCRRLCSWPPRLLCHSELASFNDHQSCKHANVWNVKI